MSKYEEREKVLNAQTILETTSLPIIGYIGYLEDVMHTTIVTGPKVYTSEIRNGLFGVVGKEKKLDKANIIHEICHLFACRLLDSPLGVFIRNSYKEIDFLSHGNVAEIVTSAVQNYFYPESIFTNTTPKTDVVFPTGENESMVRNSLFMAFEIIFKKWIKDNFTFPESDKFRKYLLQESDKLHKELNIDQKKTY